MEAASCSAVRTTLVGSIIPSLTRSPYSPSGRLAVAVCSILDQLADHNRTVAARIVDDLLGRCLDRCGRYQRRFSGRVFDLQVFESLDGTQQSDTTARQHAFSTAGAGCMRASSTRSFFSFTRLRSRRRRGSPRRRQQAWPDAPAAFHGHSPKWYRRSAT